MYHLKFHQGTECSRSKCVVFCTLWSLLSSVVVLLIVTIVISVVPVAVGGVVIPMPENKMNSSSVSAFIHFLHVKNLVLKTLLYSELHPSSLNHSWGDRRIPACTGTNPNAFITRSMSPNGCFILIVCVCLILHACIQ